MRILDDLEFIVSQPADDVRAVYERAAPEYSRFREAWLRLAGADTEAAMRDYLARILEPGQRVLDAGAGTGGKRIEGSVREPPFEDYSFDVVVSAWVIETVTDPVRAVSQYLRVINTAGYVLYTFCSLPGGWLSQAGSALLRKAVGREFAGKFLAPEETPWHECGPSRRLRFHGGLSTFILLRKCCPIAPGVLPVPMADVPPTPG